MSWVLRNYGLWKLFINSNCLNSELFPSTLRAYTVITLAASYSTDTYNSCWKLWLVGWSKADSLERLLLKSLPSRTNDLITSMEHSNFWLQHKSIIQTLFSIPVGGQSSIYAHENIFFIATAGWKIFKSLVIACPLYECCNDCMLWGWNLSRLASWAGNQGCYNLHKHRMYDSDWKVDSSLYHQKPQLMSHRPSVNGPYQSANSLASIGVLMADCFTRSACRKTHPKLCLRSKDCRNARR